MQSGRPACARYFAACLSLVLVVGCKSDNTFVPPPPPEVTVAHPVIREIADSIEFIGKTEATATVDLRARVNGYLEKIQFEDGADVVAGQQLFLIEQAPYIAAVEAATAAVQKAEAEQQLAQSQYRRLEPLVAQRAITQDELDIQAAQVSTAMADVAAAKAALRTAELDLQYTVIKAPIAGHIGRHLVDIGNLVQAEQTPLAEIQSIDPIYATFDVSERDLLYFMERLRNRELPDPDKNPPILSLGLENEKGFPRKGKLIYRQQSLDPGTGTTFRRGIFPNPGRQILPGMTVHIRAEIGDPVPQLMVEDRAVGSDQRGNYLLVVNDKNVVEYRPVMLGIAEDGFRVVREGVQQNDWVIVNGLQRARPGSTVNPQKSEMTGDQVEAPAAGAPTAATPPGARSAPAGATSPAPNAAPGPTATTPSQPAPAPANRPVTPPAATPQQK